MKTVSLSVLFLAFLLIGQCIERNSWRDLCRKSQTVMIDGKEHICLEVLGEE